MLPCLWACVPPTVHVLCAVLADCPVVSRRTGRLGSICLRGLYGVRGVMETHAAFPDSPGGRLRASPGRVPSKNDWAQSITLQLTGYQMSTAMAIAEASARD